MALELAAGAFELAADAALDAARAVDAATEETGVAGFGPARVAILFYPPGMCIGIDSSRW